MRLFPRLRGWLAFRRARKAVELDSRVLEVRISALEEKLLEAKELYESNVEDLFTVIAEVRNELIVARGQASDLEKSQERIEWENTALRDRERYVKELLLPAMTQGHARIVEMLEAETAIQIRRQTAAKE